MLNSDNTERYVEAINLLNSCYCRHSKGVRKLYITPEQISALFDLILVQKLSSSEISEILNELIRSSKTDPIQFAISKGFKISSNDLINCSNFDPEINEQIQQIADLHKARQSLANLKMNLFKAIIENWQFPVAALKYRSYKDSEQKTSNFLMLIDGFWMRQKRIQELSLKERERLFRKSDETSSQTIYLDDEDSFLMRSYNEENDDDDDDDMDEDIINELMEDTMDYNESASRSHSDGWFYDDK